MFWISDAFAQTSQTSQPNGFIQLVPALLIGFIMYFLIIRPQLKQGKEKKTLMENLRRGDEVWTAAGIYGIIDHIDTHTVKLKIAENTVVKVLKNQISAKVQKEKETESAAKTQ
jgi:preprotein translocase subunit YajC